MNILVSGASGLVGSVLMEALQGRGDQVTRLVRTATASAPDSVAWDPNRSAVDFGPATRPDAVVHLAGESIAAGRWTAARKDRILSSRVNSTRSIAAALAQLSPRPRVWVCASAIGFYGSRGEETLTESSAAGQGFLADVCRAWEAAADPARQAGIRVVHLRFGMILSARGGALPKMLTPFKLGGGGIIGNGRQMWSWVALEDVVRAILFAIQSDRLAGPVNVVSPQPVTNREFTKVLGAVLRRPTVLPMPAFAARLALGEMADELLLASARVMPGTLTAAGFEFRHPELTGALRHLLAARG